jgi:hypothetical protein
VLADALGIVLLATTRDQVALVGVDGIVDGRQPTGIGGAAGNAARRFDRPPPGQAPLFVPASVLAMGIERGRGVHKAFCRWLKDI